jgi:midasin (ATPase involved in ribosome maturation)
VSPQDNPIPGLAPSSLYSPKPAAFNILEALESLDKYYLKLSASTSLREKVVQAQKVWYQASEKLSGETQSLISVFEDHVFPVNKWTKRKAHFRGSSLHLPGLIKAVITDFNYRKFYSVKAAGGKRIYGVSLVLDSSPSMSGHFMKCAIESLTMFIGALQAIGIESFSIVIFGKSVRYLKNNNFLKIP